MLLQNEILYIKNRPLFTDSMVRRLGVVCFNHAPPAGAETTGHPGFERGLTNKFLRFDDSVQFCQHGEGPAGIEIVREISSKFVLEGEKKIDDCPLKAKASILRGDEYA